jgi:CubicO group peptidase (beta-lactamase class C family)
MRPGGNNNVNRSSLTIPLLGLLLCGLTSCVAETTTDSDDRSARVATLFEHFNEGKQPGAAVLIIEDGRTVFARGFGYADLDKGARITPDSSFRLASVSKQFTTAAVMVLAEQGKLDYDDLLVEYVPEFDSWPGVTIRHLMTHTSGIPDYYLAGYYESHDADAPMPQYSDIVEIMSNYPTPDFAPGEKYVYNDAAYEVLVEIIERVADRKFTTFLTENVFAPAGMKTATTFHSSRPDIPHRAYGYEPIEQGFELADFDPFNDMLGSGGVYATLKDFVAWAEALEENRVFTAPSLAEANRRASLNDGSIIDYGFGWRVDQYRGHARVGHGGSWVGFRTGIARYPDEGLTIVVLTNRSDGAPFRFIDRITDIYLPQRGSAYLPDESQAAVIGHHRSVPADDIWWTETGDQMAWMHRHASELFPTVEVYRDGPVRALEYAPIDEIARATVQTPDGPMPFSAFIRSDHSTAMGVVILHKGKVVFEDYPRMQEYEKPIYWSTAKVFTGAIVRLLEERGEVDVSRPIEDYVPRLAGSVFAGTTVRNVLDMALGVDCREEYEDRDSCYYRYSMAIGDGYRSEDAPDNPYDFMTTVQIERTHEQGQKFVYSGGTTFLLQWLVEEVTGYPFQDSVTKEFWRHIGAENDAEFIAYRYGIALAHGGFLAKARDLARFGLLYTPSYTVISDKQIISDAHIDLLLNGGRPHLLRNAGLPEDSPIKHNVYQWDSVDENGYIYKGGWGGQGLIVNPEKDIVAVFTSYFKDDYSEIPLDQAVRSVLNEVFTGASSE